MATHHSKPSTPAPKPKPEDAPKPAAAAKPKDAPPVVIDAPYLEGTPNVGQRLSCTMGNWENEPTDYAYEWQRDGAAIDTEMTGSSYVCGPDDEGHSIDCFVTATNAAGSATSTSNPIGPIGALEDTPGQTIGIVEEQRARSAQIQAMGVENWKAAHDERPLSERTNRQIPGVGPTTSSSSIAPREVSTPAPNQGPWQGSTPEARRYQNPTAPA